MRDMQQLSDLVTLAIKAAQAPLLERIAALEQANQDLRAGQQASLEIRDRVLTLEVKNAAPVTTQADEIALGERIMAAIHAKLPEKIVSDSPITITPIPDLGDILNRLASVETKAAGWEKPAARLEAEIVDVEQTLAVVRERVAAVEGREPPAPDLSAIVHRLSTVENFANAWQAPATKAEREIEVLTKDVGALRERVAVVEVRAQIPGPPGPAGKDGTNGVDGKAGVDGVGFDDVAVDFDGDQTLTVKFQKGDRIKAYPVRLPFQRYKAVYREGQEYHPGQIVTWGGSAWHCNMTTTTKPGDGSKDWQLMVKRGTDGRDGKDAPSLPVVTVGAK